MATHDDQLHTLLPSGLKARVLAKAKRLGISLAEGVRQALVAWLEAP